MVADPHLPLSPPASVTRVAEGGGDRAYGGGTWKEAHTLGFTVQACAFRGEADKEEYNVGGISRGDRARGLLAVMVVVKKASSTNSM